LKRVTVLEERLSLGVSAPAASLARVDEARLRQIVDAHFDTLWRFLRRLGIAEADVDDAIQEVILVLARKLSSVEPGSERSFVFSTAFRVASDMRRRAKRRREVDGEVLADVPSSARDPEASAHARRLARLFSQVLSQLSLDQRAVFVLYELEEFTMAEIAEALELPMGTVASRLRRGRETFERLANEVLSDGGEP
jgi:RNA polymerase sigma-70 factor (ECF subfamily)